MLTQVFAALGLGICIALALHMALPSRWRTRVDRTWDEFSWRLSRRLGNSLDEMRHWRQRRLSERAAVEEANEVIRRARERSRQADGEWDGNVYHGQDFGKTKPDKRNLH
jgi:hypothetical protein